jgi:hypothetical protein
VLKAALQEMLPDDAHTRIAYTVVNPLPVGTVVTEFTSKDDIIECLLGSCYVPFWFNGSATTRVRGEVVVDVSAVSTATDVCVR